MKKGLLYESEVSKRYHRLGIPLLLDPKTLRARGCGQIDCAIIKDGRVWIIEAKCSRHPHTRQSLRLLKTCRFLGLLLGLPVVQKVVIQKVYTENG